MAENKTGVKIFLFAGFDFGLLTEENKVNILHAL